VTVPIVVTGFTSSPLIYVAADEANVVSELDLGNNVAAKRLSITGLEDAPGVEGVDLYTATSLVTFNGEGAAAGTTRISRISSPTVLIGVTVANLGPDSSGSFLVRVQDGKTGVMLDDGGKAKWREITVGLRGRARVEVTNGLSAGDVVVSMAGASSGLLRDGRRIRPK